jgi:ADP-L-glycero-D-manno-heptose 6-epimerase
MVVVTGACGFIASVLVGELNKKGINDLVLVDDFDIDDRLGFAYHARYTYLQNKKFRQVRPIKFEANGIFGENKIDFIYHLGAISNTLERDAAKIRKYNIEYTDFVREYASSKGIPIVFASSAAVYGNGDGPLNLYSESKMECEKLLGESACCFRIFNVYGPNEYHKGDMSSVILKWKKESESNGSISLFRNSDKYLRDFIYVDDVCKVMANCYDDYHHGIYDLGTGCQSSFEDMSEEFLSLVDCKKEYIDIPEKIKNQYQVNTKADPSAVLAKGWIEEFTNISDGVSKYFSYLNNGERTI